MFFRRKTKENHAKSVQNVRKLLFSLGQPRKSKKKKRPNKKKQTPKNRPSPMNPGLLDRHPRTNQGMHTQTPGRIQKVDPLSGFL